MEFDKSKVYTALNADELKVGSKVIVGDTVDALRNRVQNGTTPLTLSEIRRDSYERRFRVEEYTEPESVFSFVYLISEPEVLKWTDLKIGDTIRYNNITTMVTAIDDNPSTMSHIYGYDWISDDELEDYEKVE